MPGPQDHFQMYTKMVVQYPALVANPSQHLIKVDFYGEKDFTSPSEKEEKNMGLTLSVSGSIMLIIRCVTLDASLCLSEFLFPICKMGLMIGLTSQGLGRVVCMQVLGPSCPSRFSTYYLPSFFPQGWGW